MQHERQKYLLICNTADGFAAQLNGVIVQLQLAQRLGYEPIIYLHKRSNMFGGPNPYYEESRGDNVWTYYYEPVGPSPEALNTLVERGQVFTISTASELFRLFRWDPRSWYINPFGFYRSVENTADGPHPSAWWTEQRRRARAFMENGTVRFASAMTDQVDQFVKDKFSPTVLGLQLRGSDKYDYGSGPNLGRKVLPEEYFPYIDKYLADHAEDTRIFVATDQRQWLNILQEAYPGKILSAAEASLSDSDQNSIFAAGDKAYRGVEVLIDMLLLARCDHLIKCHAAVGEMALVINPDLSYVDLNYETQPATARRTLAGLILAPLLRGVCAVWGGLAEGGMSLAQVASIEDEEVRVNPARPRSLNTKLKGSQKAPRSPILSGRFVSDVFDQLVNRLAPHCYTYKD